MHVRNEHLRDVVYPDASGISIWLCGKLAYGAFCTVDHWVDGESAPFGRDSNLRTPQLAIAHSTYDETRTVTRVGRTAAARCS